jgi:prevent-host-death family protein
MKTVQASEAKTHLPRLLDAVERGETIVITRHGRAIARLVPEAGRRKAEVAAAIEGLEALRRSGDIKGLSVEEILASIHEGHRY